MYTKNVLVIWSGIQYTQDTPTTHTFHPILLSVPTTPPQPIVTPPICWTLLHHLRTLSPEFLTIQPQRLPPFTFSLPNNNLFSIGPLWHTNMSLRISQPIVFPQLMHRNSRNLAELPVELMRQHRIPERDVIVDLRDYPSRKLGIKLALEVQLSVDASREVVAVQELARRSQGKQMRATDILGMFFAGGFRAWGSRPEILKRVACFDGWGLKTRPKWCWGSTDVLWLSAETAPEASAGVR